MGTYQGCPSGYVCLYPNARWNGGHPTYKWYTYGAHNPSNQFGVKRLFNNQTGGAIARNCTGYNGTGCQGIQTAGTYADYDYTSYNSVLLSTARRNPCSAAPLLPQRIDATPSSRTSAWPSKHWSPAK